MSPDSDGIGDPWDRFDDALASARNLLETGRNRYEILVEMNESPTDRYVSALQNVEAEIEAVDDVLDVSEEDAVDAESVAKQAELVADALDAAWTFQTSLLDAEFDIYRTWHASLESRDAVDCSDATDELDSIAELVQHQNYTLLRTGDQFTLENLRRKLASAERRAMAEATPREYVQRCLDAVDRFWEETTQDLKHLVQADAPVQVKSERAAVTELTDGLGDRLDEQRVDDGAVDAARYALEGAMMLRYYTAHARYAYEYCDRLSEGIERVDDAEPVVGGEVNRVNLRRRDDAEPVGERHVEERDVDFVRGRVEDAIVGTTTKTDAERVVDLLHEHDGSLDRALAASELDTNSFFDGLRTAFEEETINDIEVSFA